MVLLLLLLCVLLLLIIREGLVKKMYPKRFFKRLFVDPLKGVLWRRRRGSPSVSMWRTPKGYSRNLFFLECSVSMMEAIGKMCPSWRPWDFPVDVTHTVRWRLAAHVNTLCPHRRKPFETRDIKANGKFKSIQSLNSIHGRMCLCNFWQHFQLCRRWSVGNICRWITIYFRHICVMFTEDKHYVMHYGETACETPWCSRDDRP